MLATTVANPQGHAERSGAAGLENSANNLSARERRALRFGRRAALWRASNLRRLRHCGRVPRSSAGVDLRCREGVAGYSGLQHCGSVWACPVCAGRILVHRALEIGVVLGRAVEQGHRLGFFTLTMRHDRSQPLDQLWPAAQAGWQRAISGRGWSAESEAVDGWVRVWEVTHGRNGWHVHVHGVLVLPDSTTSADLDRIGRGMFDRWSRGLVASGLRAPTMRGQDWHLVTGSGAAEEVGRYLSKLAESSDPGRDLGLELTHSSPGRAAAALKTRPVWCLLDDLVETGEARALALWHEWERASRGKRHVGWSRGLRDRFAPEVEDVDDQAVVDAEVGTSDDDVLHLSRPAWRDLVTVPVRLVVLLEAVEGGGVVAAVARLDSWGIAWSLPERGGGRPGPEALGVPPPSPG